MSENNWFEEKFYLGKARQGFLIKEHLHTEQTPYQKIDVYDTDALGRLLVLDNKTMVSDLDEFVYHEIMGHVPSMVVPNAEKVLIIGGGDGGCVREFVRHQNLKQIDLVEIDERVIEVSKKYFPQCTKGLDDPRVSVLPTDGIKFIADKKEAYDIIIIDSTDPEDFAEGLFTSEFYANVRDALTPDGVMMAQTENPFYDEYDIGKIYSNLKNAFPIIGATTAPMIIYPGVFWTFAFASKKTLPTELLEEKKPQMKKLQKTLKWYNMDWHVGSFSLPNFVKEKLGF